MNNDTWTAASTTTWPEVNINDMLKTMEELKSKYKPPEIDCYGCTRATLNKVMKQLNQTLEEVYLPMFSLINTIPIHVYETKEHFLGYLISHDKKGQWIE